MQSMQEHDTFPGKIYAVTCASGCTITDNKGRTLGECEAGKQTLVVATSDKLMTSADALVTATFNAAPAIGAGGGATITFDAAPTKNSLNAVTSGGIYNALLFSRPGLAMSIGTDTRVGAFGLSIGYGAGGSKQNSVALGYKATTDIFAVAIGCEANATGEKSLAIGKGSLSKGAYSAAIGYSVSAQDQGINVAGVFDSASTIQTLFYIIGANTSLANTYENGEACLGYLVKDTSGNVLACGTRKLSELLTNNTAFAPASMDLDAPLPTPFLPTGAMEPIDLTEPEEYVEFNF